uniref:Uncharacterized protein n=1 Tax=viral metagenome TaxID=1070528 RepID=A0A6M3LH90_9ZZZZ
MKVTPLIVPFVGHYLYGVERVEVVPWAWNQVVMHEFGHYYDDVMLVQFSPLGQEIMNVLKVSEWDHRAREKFATALGMIAHRPWRYRPTNAIHRLVRPLVKD